MSSRVRSSFSFARGRLFRSERTVPSQSPGSEAGGHGLIASRPLDTLLPQVVQLAATSSTPVPVIGAGGLMTGADLAHVLSLGAAGGVMGTRFLTTREATYPEAKKQAVAQAGLQHEQGKDKQPATGRSVAWDRAGNVPWPGAVSLSSPSSQDLDALTLSLARLCRGLRRQSTPQSYRVRLRRSLVQRQRPSRARQPSSAVQASCDSGQPRPVRRLGRRRRRPGEGDSECGGCSS